MNTKQNLKILTIGNSFTNSLTQYFPEVVKSTGCDILLELANHSGCELSRHWRYIDWEEQDAAVRMYQEPRIKMRDILARETWDIVTIQQASRESWRAETYQPYATNIYEYVKQYAPQAEVVIQQTWSYREDDPRIMPDGEWGINQNSMYELLTKAYRKLAAELNLRIIPTGYAVQLARQQQPFRFQNYDPAMLETIRWPDMPSQAGSLVGVMSWRKGEDGELKLMRDSIHLNLRGQYLQACVWFAFLYGRNVKEITFVPQIIGDSDAQFLREIARQAVNTFEQLK